MGKGVEGEVCLSPTGIVRAGVLWRWWWRGRLVGGVPGGTAGGEEGQVEAAVGAMAVCVGGLEGGRMGEGGWGVHECMSGRIKREDGHLCDATSKET